MAISHSAEPNKSLSPWATSSSGGNAAQAAVLTRRESLSVRDNIGNAQVVLGSINP